jgi:hypothetical protein
MAANCRKLSTSFLQHISLFKAKKIFSLLSYPASYIKMESLLEGSDCSSKGITFCCTRQMTVGVSYCWKNTLTLALQYLSHQIPDPIPVEG